MHYSEEQLTKRRRTNSVITVLGLVGFFLALIFWSIYSKNQNDKHLLEVKIAEIARKHADSIRKHDSLENAKSFYLIDSAQNSKYKQVDSVANVDELADSLSQTFTSLNLEKITINFSAKNKFDQQVAEELKSMGYNVNMVDTKNSIAINAIKYGDGIDISIVRQLTAKLISKGYYIRTVGPFESKENFHKNKFGIIEVYSSPKFLAQNPISVKDILKIK